MMTYKLMIIATMLLTQAFCATLVSSSPRTDTPARLSYEEMVYILQERSGLPANTKPITLSPCARAILGCCKNKQMNESCSESLRCGAFFFDDNPCDDKFIIEALNAAKTFYAQQTTQE